MADPMEAVRRLLDLRHRSRPEDLPPILDDVAPLLGAARITALMVDYEQISLWPLHGTVDDSAPRKVDDTQAGQAFSTARTAYEEPERLGVLEVWLASDPGSAGRRDFEAIAALVAELIASRRFYGDAVELTRRRQPMQLAAEIIWNQLPPLTFAANGTLVTAVLEPCYDVGGDAFDYAANGDLVHVALFDTVGHGIGASALTTLTLNTYRNARRCGLGLTDTYRSIDKWIRAQYPGAFVTAVLAELDTRTGAYRRIAAGHPSELHLRGDRSMPALPTPTALPLGLGHMLRRPPAVTEVMLEPGDVLVLYTDGITEARSADGELFGVDRLGAFVRDEMRRDIPAPELMRHLIHMIVSYENGELRADATAALVQWCPPR